MTICSTSMSVECLIDLVYILRTYAHVHSLYYSEFIDNLNLFAHFRHDGSTLRHLVTNLPLNFTS